MFWTILIAVVGLVLFYFLTKRSLKTPKGRKIPGPPGRSIVGCALEIQPENIHLKFTEYAEKYGDIVQIRMFSQNIIILNEEKLIKRTFTNENFCDRAGMFYGKHFRAGNRSVAFIEEGNCSFQKIAKRAYIHSLHTYGTGIYKLETTVRKELSNFVATLTGFDGKPFDVTQTLGRSLSNVMSLALSGELLSTDDTGDTTADLFWQHVRANDFFLNAANDMILTTFPFLRFMPGKLGNEYRLGKAANAKISKLYFYDIKKTHVPGVHRGIVDWYLDEQKKQKESGSDVVFTDEEIIAQIVESIDAGLTTSSSTLTTTMLVLMNHPEIQAKIQAEIDRVIKDAEPEAADRDECVYFKAFELELHRIAPTLPITLPRLCRRHIEYDGYDIPANSVLFGNIWKIQHDEKVWGDPWNFRPERFIDDEGNLLAKEHPLYKSLMPFGIGQRICPGEKFARVRYFLYLSTMLQRWTLTFPEGVHMSCDPRDSKSFAPSLIFRTRPFKCCAIPRKK
ncbi:Cytochrome P450 1A1 [Mactra antiquata]